jgi:hypothetical protein
MGSRFKIRIAISLDPDTRYKECWASHGQCPFPCYRQITVLLSSRDSSAVVGNLRHSKNHKLAAFFSEDLFGYDLVIIQSGGRLVFVT